MKYTKQTVSFADDLIDQYVQKNIDGYYITLDCVPEEELSKLLFLMLSGETALMAESTSLDNDEFDKVLVPEIMNVLKSYDDKLSLISLGCAIRDSMLNYYKPHLEELFSWRLENYLNALMGIG